MLNLGIELLLVSWIALSYGNEQFGFYAFSALLTLYALYTLYHLARGRTNLQCMCFGATPNPLNFAHAITNLIIASITLLLAQFSERATTWEIPAYAAFGVLLGATAINVSSLAELLRPLKLSSGRQILETKASR